MYIHIVGLWFGKMKPKSAEELMDDFVEECNEVVLHGLVLNGQMHTLSSVLFICDSPVRAFLKNIIAHNDLHGCERCTAQGVSCNSRMVFNTPVTLSAQKTLTCRVCAGKIYWYTSNWHFTCGWINKLCLRLSSGLYAFNPEESLNRSEKSPSQ